MRGCKIGVPWFLSCTVRARPSADTRVQHRIISEQLVSVSAISRGNPFHFAYHREIPVLDGNDSNGYPAQTSMCSG